MENVNNYSWNKTLKFSWGHIIAFIALIFISYVTYMGDFYQNGGDFGKAAIKVLIIDILLLCTFIGAQIYKGTDEKFKRSIIIERILICFCPIAFCWMMLTYNHFWTVLGQHEGIETKFNQAINKSKQLFTEYNTYANNRIEKYDQFLTSVIHNKNKDVATYHRIGFSGGDDQMQKQDYVRTLQLQLLSQNTDSLEYVANKWIDDANQGASVWNAFLVGNIKEISRAITGWNKTLTSYSKPVLSNEANAQEEITAFGDNNSAIRDAIQDLTDLRQIYMPPKKGINIQTIWTGIILFIMLLFPYLLQSRNTKANGVYSLLPFSLSSHTERKKERNDKVEYDETNKSDATQNESNGDIYSGTF